ncbi:MAG: DTW domain-containing protein [Pseudomonadales bacterium]|nr:DTW domain-containing protein [Pseudomonadales bacterium]
MKKNKHPTIFLLTHQRELKKKSNTGRLVIDSLGHYAKIIIWERTQPNAELLHIISEGNVALLYPTESSVLVADAPTINHYIIIDGTWQEAQKIYNKSPYLKNLPTVRVDANQKSAYTLRRNQKENGLCTAECVIETLRARSHEQSANDLQSALTEFLSAKMN